MKNLFVLLVLCSSLAFAQTPQAKSSATPAKTEVKVEMALTEPESKTLADLQTRASKLCAGDCGQAQVNNVVVELRTAKGKDAILAAALLFRDVIRQVEQDNEADKAIQQDFQALVTAGRNRTKCDTCVPNTKTGQWEKPANPVK